MARLSFLHNFKKLLAGDTAEQTYRTTFSCIGRVAAFLGIAGQVYTPSLDDKVTRKEYVREYTDANGVKQVVTVAAGQIVYTAFGKANSRTVVLITGGKTEQKNRKKLYLTFPNILSVSQIGDALGEIIPPANVAAQGTIPTASQIFPFFTIKGGKTYPLPTAAVASATPAVNVATTEAEQTVVLSESIGRKRKLVLAP